MKKKVNISVIMETNATDAEIKESTIKALRRGYDTPGNYICLPGNMEELIMEVTEIEVYYRAQQMIWEELFDVNGQRWKENEVFYSKYAAELLYPESPIDTFENDDIPNRVYVEVETKQIVIHKRK